MKVQTHYEEGTPEGVRIALEQAIKNGPDHRYRIFYGDPATGKDYGEEQDVIGWISRSTGEQKVPIILAQKNSSFGSPIHTRIVVKIIHTNVNRVVYRHPRYDPGEYTILRELSHPNLPIAVKRDGQTVARFTDQTKARNWMSFMQGRRQKP